MTQIGSGDVRRTILLRCPRCEDLYENAPQGEDAARRLQPAQATFYSPAHCRCRFRAV